MEKKMTTRRTAGSKLGTLTGHLVRPSISTAHSAAKSGNSSNIKEIQDIINSYGMPIFNDGYSTRARIEEVVRNRNKNTSDTGAYVAGVRGKISNQTEFLCPSNDLNYHLGAVILTDSQFKSNAPQKCIFREDEREPIRIVASLGWEGCNGSSYSHYVNPNEADINSFKNRFLNEYAMKANTSTFVASNTRVNAFTYSSVDAISIGGSISGASFGFDKSTTKKVKVIEIKQRLFSMSVNDTLINADDFFTDQLSATELKSKLYSHHDKRYCAPAYIETIHYGRAIYLAVASTDSTAYSANIGYKGNTLKGSFGKSFSKCEFSLITRGGVSGRLSNYNGTFDYDTIGEVLKAIGLEMAATEVEAAMPIEFEAKYIRNPQINVKYNTNPYFINYIDQVKFRVVDSNTGVDINLIIRYLDSVGYRRYKYNYRKSGTLSPRSNTYTINVSPKALAFEVKVNRYGNESSDFNVFIPFIPYESLQCSNDGEYYLNVYLPGTTLWSPKRAYTIPSVDGTYLTWENDLFILDKNNSVKTNIYSSAFYQNKNEDEIIKEFFRWCEAYTRVRTKKGTPYMSLVSPDHPNKSGRY